MKKILFSLMLVVVVGLQASEESDGDESQVLTENDCKHDIYRLLRQPERRRNVIEVKRLALRLSQYPQIAQDVEILHDAVWREGTEFIVELLLQHGADPNKSNKKVGSAMKQAIDIAMQYGHDHRMRYKPVIKLLMQYGGNVDASYTAVRSTAVRSWRDFGFEQYQRTLRENCPELIAEIEAEIAQERLEQKALECLMAELALGTKMQQRNTGITVSTAQILDNQTLLKK